MPALRTARQLDDLAYLAKAPDVIRSAAFRLWLAPFQAGLADRPKTETAALEGLRSFERSLSAEEATKAREFIRGLSREQLLHTEPRIGRIPSGWFVEYRGPGRSAHFRKSARKRFSRDDLSERIWEAYHALKKSGCKEASEYIAQVLGESWTRQRVESRLKAFKRNQVDAWPNNDWRRRYAFEHPDPKEGPLPEVFVFAPYEP
jgi:hypothetical protein